MKLKGILRAVFAIISFLVLVFIDQFTKHLAVVYLKDKDPFVLIHDVFVLEYLENRGAAFGILQGKRFVFVIITVIVVILLAYCFSRIPSTKRFHSLRLVIVLIASGAIGNFIDRSGQGYVVDFFYFELINFPVFNVADIYVTCSAILLIILILFIYKEKDMKELSESFKRKK